MKVFEMFFFGTVLLSMNAMAGDLPGYEVRVLPNVKLAEVTCHEPYHIDHSNSLAGQVITVDQSGHRTVMFMMVSRFADTVQEAQDLCASLKKAQASGENLDVIFEARGDRDRSNLNIKGAVKLHGLNPLFWWLILDCYFCTLDELSSSA